MNNRPDYKGKIDVAAWKKVDKNGEVYLSVNLGGIHFNLFKNKFKDEEL